MEITDAELDGLHNDIKRGKTLYKVYENGEKACAALKNMRQVYRETKARVDDLKKKELDSKSVIDAASQKAAKILSDAQAKGSEIEAKAGAVLSKAEAQAQDVVDKARKFERESTDRATSAKQESTEFEAKALAAKTELADFETKLEKARLEAEKIFKR
jgi:vacuolar-type H+-ATPase subunit H